MTRAPLGERRHVTRVLAPGQQTVRSERPTVPHVSQLFGSYS